MQNYVSFKYSEVKIKRTTCYVIWFCFYVCLRVDAVTVYNFAVLLYEIVINDVANKHRNINT